MTVATRSFNVEVNNIMHKIKNLLAENLLAINNQERLTVCLEIYKMINNSFPKFLSRDPIMFNRLAAAMYNKTTEFYNNILEGIYNDIPDKELVTKSCQEFMKAREFLTIYFKNLRPDEIDMTCCDVVEVYNNLYEEEQKKPRRNIRRNVRVV
jgi:hypothetical protein